ncbi:hypothetical protein L208DRAFT_198908 [Tricholoma matsutake]|nr:hypothetical protein L208DRAFT_198908 [Tricholoma matsutake 945]
MSTSPKSSRIMTSACSAHLWPHSHLNMDLTIYTPTWHPVLLFGKYSAFSNPMGSHPLCTQNNEPRVRIVLDSSEIPQHIKNGYPRLMQG